MYTVEEILQKHKIVFQHKGADFIVKCINPNHEDRNPSLRIDKITGIFNCFSCGFKGNLFSFYGETPNIMQVKRQKLKKKIESLRAESIGLLMPNGYTEYKGTYRGIKAATYSMFRAFEHTSREFLGRINFPITDAAGNICAFIGRTTVGDLPKYYIYPTEAKLPLYPVVTPIQGSVILVEGIFDMLNMHQNGLDNTICCFGVKTVNENKLKLLKVSGVSFIYIMMDADEAGKAGAERLKELCEKVEIPCKVITLREKDPGQLSGPQIQKLKDKLYDSSNRDETE